MTFTKGTATVKSLCHTKGNKYKKIKTDLIWQRQFVWNTERQSLFIHTLMENGYVYPILVSDEEGSDNVSLLDGLQRISTCRNFIAGNLKLDVNTPDIGEHTVAKKTFKQLPVELQDAILDYSLDLIYVRGASEEELGDLFHRLNQSEPLTKTTLLRSVVGVSVAKFIERFEEMDFFKNRIVISDSARKTHGLTEMVLQCLSLYTMHNGSFSSRDLKKFAFSMKESPLSEDTVTAFEEAVTYLELVFPEVVEDGKVYVYEYLKKTAIPLLVKLAEVALENGIDESDFFDFVESFFAGKTKYGISYKSRAASGTSTKKNVMARFGLMLDGFKEHMAELGQKDLVIPQNCDFSVWAQQEAEAKAIAEALKLQRKADAQAKREETKRKKAERELAKAQAKADATTVNSDTDEVDDTDEEELDINGTSVEDDVLEETVLDAIVKASNGNKVGQAEFDKIKESLVGELFGAQA